MDKKLKTKWVKALRSGKFKQGSGRLRRQNAGKVTHCCLGVLCEIAKESISTGMCYLPSPFSRDVNIDEAVQERLSTANDRCDGDDYYQKEFKLRKNQKHASFRQIATWIEKNL